MKNLKKWHVYYHGCQGRQLQQKTLFSGGERLMENNYYRARIAQVNFLLMLFVDASNKFIFDYE